MARKISKMNAPSAEQNAGPSAEEIAARAYTYYCEEGCVEGRATDHWLRAEAELLAEKQQKMPEASTPTATGDTSSRARRTAPNGRRR